MPITPFGNAVTPTCVQNVWPLWFGGNAPDVLTPIAGDIDSTATNILVCGKMVVTTYSDGLAAGFILEMNMIFIYHYMHSVNIGTTLSSIDNC
jgi:hypothetical protein